VNTRQKLALLERVAIRAATRPEYLGWVLARYAAAEDTTDAMIAKMLNVPEEDLRRVRLCLRPRSQSFADDVGQLARKFGLDAATLATMVRHVDALEGMKDFDAAAPASDAGVLMAARARKQKPATPTQRKKHAPRAK